jgi:Ni2+-binding GTPase involved in maturation of urease and hydrogenase
MRLVTVSGPPSSGKTSVILRVLEYIKKDNSKIGVIKFDCLSTYDDKLYEKASVPVKVGLSGNLCPDHFFVSNIEDCVKWGERQDLEYLISESAGLCNRCSPHIKEITAVCVIDCLSGVNTPKKIGPMLKLADIVVITKGDIVSQAEREVFSFKVKQANSQASIIFVNGITGQGAFDLSNRLKNAANISNLEGKRLRFSMPAALCSYCLGETRIGEEFQTGNLKKMDFGDVIV